MASRVHPGLDVGVEHFEEILEAAAGGIVAEGRESIERRDVGVEIVEEESPNRGRGSVPVIGAPSLGSSVPYITRLMFALRKWRDGCLA